MIVLNAPNFTVALQQEYVTIRHCAEENFIWNEWRGAIPSQQLREAMFFSCEFIIAHNIEFILADFSKMNAPAFEDQVWIANRSAAILQHSKLKRVANVLAMDIFEQLAIESIYEMASEIPLPCQYRDFISEQDALEWLVAPQHAHSEAPEIV
ncbi:hypothetical protein [Pontibacter liquoris]|uniref:hypothetical protein n=1 Tax=Pontibacter liquoris TaxID=2905677 RepID=UPI001FA7A316|nr:hypothetical protein [Pontibacter liquoris]